jgi:hypothetical protein
LSEKSASQLQGGIWLQPAYGCCQYLGYSYQSQLISSISAGIFGAEVFAEFSNGFIDIPFVGMVTGAASARILMPMFSKMIHDKSNIEDVLNTLEKCIAESRQ